MDLISINLSTYYLILTYILSLESIISGMEIIGKGKWGYIAIISTRELEYLQELERKSDVREAFAKDFKKELDKLELSTRVRNNLVRHLLWDEIFTYKNIWLTFEEWIIAVKEGKIPKIKFMAARQFGDLAYQELIEKINIYLSKEI